MRPRGRTRQSWRFSRHPVAISSPRKRPRASAIMWRCRSSAPTACSRAVTSAPRWPRKLIKASPIPYTIVRATQFFEFVGGIAQGATEGQTVRVPPAPRQPIAADDAAAVVAEVTLAKPLGGTFDLAGPEPIRQDDLVRQFLKATGDTRTVVTDPKALYYGIEVNDQSLTPGDHPRLGPTRFKDWLSRNAAAGAAPDTGRTGASASS